MLDKTDLAEFILKHYNNIEDLQLVELENEYNCTYANYSLRIRVPKGYNICNLKIGDVKKKYIKDCWSRKSDSLHDKIAGMIEMSDDPEGVKKAAESVVAETKDFFYKMLDIEE